MSLLEYERTAMAQPEMRAAAGHLLVWGIVNYIFAWAFGLLVGMCVLGLVLSVLSAELGAAAFVLMLGFVPGFLTAFFVSYGRSCLSLRRRMISGGTNEAKTAQRTTIVPMMLVACLFAVPILLGGSGLLLNEKGFAVPAVVTAIVIAGVEALIVWTYRVLGRAGRGG